KDAASRFGEAWSARDYRAMYRELNEESRARTSFDAFAGAYRDAATTATLRGLIPASPRDPQKQDGRTVVPLPITLTMAAFGRSEDQLLLPWSGGGINWDESLVFPGLKEGEQLGSEIELAPRAPILAGDGTPLATGPATEREHPLGSAA